MGKTNSIKAWSVTADILFSIGEAVEDILVLSTNPRLRYYGLEWREELARKDWIQRNEKMNWMQKNGLLKKKMDSNKVEVALTKKGLEELARVRVLRSDLLPVGKICLVIFDIPETSRAVRNKLRSLLGRSAFIPLQRSVWYSPFDVRSSLGELLKLSGMGKWVKIFIAEDKTQNILKNR